MYGLSTPAPNYTQILSPLHRQAAANWSGSKVVTLPMVPRGVLVGSMSADSGTVTAVTQAGYRWTKVLETNGADCSSIWVGVPIAQLASVTVTFTGGGGSFFNPTVIELATAFEVQPILVASGIRTQTSALTLDTPTVTADRPCIAVAAVASSSGGAAIQRVVGGGGWVLASGANTFTLCGLATATVLPGNSIFARFGRVSGTSLAAGGIVLIGEPGPRREWPR